MKFRLIIITKCCHFNLAPVLHPLSTQITSSIDPIPVLTFVSKRIHTRFCIMWKYYLKTHSIYIAQPKFSSIETFLLTKLILEAVIIFQTLKFLRMALSYLYPFDCVFTGYKHIAFLDHSYRQSKIRGSSNLFFYFFRSK